MAEAYAIPTPDYNYNTDELSETAPEFLPQFAEPNTVLNPVVLPRQVGPVAAPVEMPPHLTAPQEKASVMDWLLGQGKLTNEKLRRQRAADQTQAMIGMLNNAFLSGPEALTSTITQFSKLKGLEPETVDKLMEYQLKIGMGIKQKQEEDAEEETMAATLSQASPEYKDVIGTLIRASGGKLRLSGAVQLLKSGLFGEPSRTYNTSNGLERTAPTGLFARGYTGPMETTVISAPGPGGRTKSINTNDLVAYAKTQGKIKGPTIPDDMTWQQAEATVKGLQEKTQILLPEAFKQREALAGVTAAAGATERKKIELQDEIRAINEIRPKIMQITEMASRLFTAKSPAEANTLGVAYWLGANTGTHPLAAEYVKEVDSWADLIGRNLGGQKGVITDRDTLRLKGMFASWNSTAARTAFKQQGINLIIETAIAARQAQIEGKPLDLEATRKRIKKMVDDLEGKVKAGEAEDKKLMSLPPPPPGFQYAPGTTDILINPSTGQMKRLQR